MSTSKKAYVLAASLGLTACSVLSTPAFADRTHFDFWYGNTGQISQVVQNMCQAFNKSQNKYEVECTTQGGYDNTLQNTIAAFRAQKQPTLVQISDIGTATMMLSHAIVPVPQLMKQNGYNIDWNDFFPGIYRYYATSKGQMLSFPFNSSTAMLYWNKDLFAKIGKETPPKTVEEMGADMQALKKAGVSCPFATNVSPDESWQLMEETSAINNQPVATLNNGYQGLNAKLVINKTKFVDYVKHLKNWYDNGLLQLKSAQSGEGYTQAFASGQCAMTITSIGDDGTIAQTQKKGMHWGVAEMPVFQGVQRKNSMVGGASLWVLKGHSNAQYAAAAAFLNWLHEPEQIRYWSGHTGYIPVTNSGFQYMKAHNYYAKEPEKDRLVAIQSLTASEPTPITSGIRLGNFTAIRRIFSDEMQAILTNKESVQQGLDNIVNRGNVVLSRFERTYPGAKLP